MVSKVHVLQAHEAAEVGETVGGTVGDG